MPRILLQKAEEKFPAVRERMLSVSQRLMHCWLQGGYRVCQFQQSCGKHIRRKHSSHGSWWADSAVFCWCSTKQHRFWRERERAPSLDEPAVLAPAVRGGLSRVEGPIHSSERGLLYSQQNCVELSHHNTRSVR
ncbi:uncharacterized protein LOC111867453 isoform X2 [Cryptotermes secundus]|uniref:uncharacterized protein LOC111867453 isoform X2 n=1 Tax=Cryptotermes secundus TaxID=105785 RepID=UPI001454C543|nr:uncharacterized protein LOC111867453 isoform X2 [Cryptotermes secundus]